MMDFYTLQLSVKTEGDNANIGELWRRKVLAAWLPRQGERIAMLTDPEDVEGDVHTEVTEVYYAWDGQPTVVLRGCLLDPTPEMADANSRLIHASNPRIYRSGWWTDRDGDLSARLRESGWLPYDEWRENR